MLIIVRGTPWVFPSRSGDNKHARDVDFLNSYADQQWEVGNIVKDFIGGGGREKKLSTNSMCGILYNEG